MLDAVVDRREMRDWIIRALGFTYNPEGRLTALQGRAHFRHNGDGVLNLPAAEARPKFNDHAQSARPRAVLPAFRDELRRVGQIPLQPRPRDARDQARARQRHAPAPTPRRPAYFIPLSPDRRHERQGLDRGDARKHHARGRTARGALHLAAPRLGHGARARRRPRNLARTSSRATRRACARRPKRSSASRARSRPSSSR